jgi:hypothetical protein
MIKRYVTIKPDARGEAQAVFLIARREYHLNEINGFYIVKTIKPFYLI